MSGAWALCSAGSPWFGVTSNSASITSTRMVDERKFIPQIALEPLGPTQRSD